MDGDAEMRIVSGDLESPSKVPRRTFQLRTRVCFVTWNRSQVQDHVEFHEMLRDRLPAGTQLFGGQERHADGAPHYHVVIRFPRRIYWRDARKELMLPLLDTGEIDTRSIRIEVPNRNPRLGPVETEEGFLERTQAYSSKDRNIILFGDWIHTGQQCGECQRVISQDGSVVCSSCAEDYRIKVSVCAD